MKLSLTAVSYSVDDIRAGLIKLKTSVQRCNQEVLVSHEQGTLHHAYGNPFGWPANTLPQVPQYYQAIYGRNTTIVVIEELSKTLWKTLNTLNQLNLYC